MNKLLLPILCLCLAVWLFGGSVWFGEQFAKSDQNQSWTVLDGTQKFHSPTIFSFQISDSEVILDDNQLALIADIAQYMTDHKGRNLLITGDYTDQETNDSDYDNLGLARARSFRYLLYRQGIDLDRIIERDRLVDAHQLNSNGLINGGVVFTFIESPFVKYGPDFSLSKDIHFKKGSNTTLKMGNFNQYIAAVRQYLVDFPDKKIQLTGFYKKAEKDITVRKRAYNLERNLTKIGISSERLSTTLEALENFQAENSYVEIRIY